MITPRSTSSVYSDIRFAAENVKFDFRTVIMGNGMFYERRCIRARIRSASLHASPIKNRRFCTLAGGERRLRARATVIGDVRVTVPGIPICYTSEAPGNHVHVCEVASLGCARLFIPPLFVLLVQPHAYEETVLVNNSARVTLSDERA